MVYQIPTIDHLFVPVNRVFEVVAVPNPGWNSGQSHILAPGVHNAAASKEKPFIGNRPQGQNGGVFSVPEGKGLLFFQRSCVHPFQPLGFFRPQVAVVDLVHGFVSQYAQVRAFDFLVMLFFGGRYSRRKK